MAEGVGIGQTSPHPEWRILVEHLRHADYGTEISHDEVSDLIGLSVGDIRYHRHVGRARIELRHDFQRELETVNGKGYRLVLPHEFHGRARRELRLAGKRLRASKDVLVAAPQHLLTDEQNRRNADALAKVGRVESMRLGAMRDTRPTLPAPPRPDVPKMIGA